MPSIFDPLVEIVHSGKLDAWKQRNEEALAAFFGSRYPKRAEKAVALRAPDMRGSDSGVPYAAYLHPSNADAGAYGGMSFVIFPVEGERCLVAMVIGTQGLAPDESILGRPGHSRKMLAISIWLNHQFGRGDQVAWAKQDPTRVDIDIPESIQRAWSAYERVFKRYGRVLYALYKPTEDRAGTIAALTAMLDVMFEERGHSPLKDFQQDSIGVQSAWFSHLMPKTDNEHVFGLLKNRRFVVLQGPPGTGKTRLARQLLANDYGGFGRSVQFHPSTTYENFVGGLAPIENGGSGGGGLGFRFAPKPGFLLEAAAQAADSAKPYLLHIDEVNRADLGKILGEAIYLFEANPESRREIDLPYDFGRPFHQRLYLPDNLHVLGTMNSADRSIAIVDVAVRRRFAFLSLWPSLDVVEEHGCPLTQRAFKELVSIFVEHAPDEALALVPGHSYFLGKDEEQARVNLRTSLAPLLAEYLAQGYVSGFAESIRGYMQWLESL
ncbi:putative GTPase subunit of restriction endonuclease [Candidatus Sulfopaludibacter sp. SbA6]|nr:putative GTPase subunit of restriction endonuclease [Candidatus Sulfopaludibacter sp. SbA6]